MKKYPPKYTFKLDKAFLIALGICIVSFYLSPRIEAIHKNENAIPFFRIDVVDIPQTKQLPAAGPRPQKPFLQVLPEETEILDDVDITSEELEINTFSGINDVIPAAESLPVQPRQILEVVPQNTDKQLQGEITLMLRIGMDGKVKEERILSDTIKDSDCLEQVLSAARMSRWQPVRIKGQKVEYWIEKSYIFD